MRFDVTGKMLSGVELEDIVNGILLIPAQVNVVHPKAFNSLFKDELTILDTLNEIQYQDTRIKKAILIGLLHGYKDNDADKREVLKKLINTILNGEGELLASDIAILENDKKLDKILRLTGHIHIIGDLKSEIPQVEQSSSTAMTKRKQESEQALSGFITITAQDIHGMITPAQEIKTSPFFREIEAYAKGGIRTSIYHFFNKGLTDGRKALAKQFISRVNQLEAGDSALALVNEFIRYNQQLSKHYHKANDNGRLHRMLNDLSTVLDNAERINQTPPVAP